MVSRSASAGTTTGFRNDAGGGAERSGDAEPVPALGSPRFLERHAGPDDRQPGPAAEVGDPLVDGPPGTARTVGRHAQMAPVDPQAHLAERTHAAPRRRAPDHAESQPPDHLGDQLAVAVVADQDVHLGPVPVIGRKEHDLVEERVDVPLAGLPGDLGGDRRGPCTGSGT